MVPEDVKIAGSAVISVFVNIPAGVRTFRSRRPTPPGFIWNRCIGNEEMKRSVILQLLLPGKQLSRKVSRR